MAMNSNFTRDAQEHLVNSLRPKAEALGLKIIELRSTSPVSFEVEEWRLVEPDGRIVQQGRSGYHLRAALSGYEMGLARGRREQKQVTA